MLEFTVITVSLNSCDFIAEALDSVQAQNYVAVEHIVVDGGSTDGTVDAIASHADAYPRLHWISERDRGIAHAMNKGLAMASGEIVGFLHADDYYLHPEVLTNVASAFNAHPMTIWATGGMRVVNAERRMLREIAPRTYSFRRLLRSNIILHPATFVKRSSLLDVGGFNERYRYAMDYDLWLRLGQVSAPLPIDELLSSFRLHPGSRSSSNPDAAFDEEYLIRAEYLKRTGALLWPHKAFHLLKKPFNSLLYSRHLNGMKGSD